MTLKEQLSVLNPSTNVCVVGYPTNDIFEGKAMKALDTIKIFITKKEVKFVRIATNSDGETCLNILIEG